jgi:transcriptional regulator with GAF, ATPase, and Fis domain
VPGHHRQRGLNRWLRFYQGDGDGNPLVQRIDVANPGYPVPDPVETVVVQPGVAMPQQQGPHLRTLSHFTYSLLLSDNVESMLRHLVCYVNLALMLAGSAVTVAEGKHLQFAAGLPAHTIKLERVQYGSGCGPCITAHETGQVVAVADLRQQADRWPRYCALAEQVSMLAVAALPLRLGSEGRGVLDLYFDTPHQWAPEELAAASVLADITTSQLINTARMHSAQRLSEQLQGALDSRSVIEQAKGIVADSHGVDVEEAYRRIRRYARGHHASIHMVAEAIVRVGLRPP